MSKHATSTSSAPSVRHEEVAPRASALAESLRAFGYDLGTAIADLVDNSISAGAKRVWIDFQWAGKESSIAITDDGRGMTEEKLRDAMRLGSRHPGEARDSSDLGRFGLGLKTASFSQCRCVTAFTKQSPTDAILRRWDLDHLAKTDAWHVLLDARADAAALCHRLGKLRSGTCVLWQHMDRIMRGCAEKRDAFIARCESVEHHLALVFHRMIEDGKVKLFVNDHPVRPFDPFFAFFASQTLEERRLASPGGIVHIEPFVLPHESKLADADERKAAGDLKDWTARQGFYIYRQDRLLVAGSWLGYSAWRKDELHKLARIRISLPNTSDEDWQIDVTKSKARPPEHLREEIRRIGSEARNRAKRVYSFRGERLTPSGKSTVKHVWDQVMRHGVSHYRINREHPLISSLLMDKASRKPVEAALKLIEQTLPVALIAWQASETTSAPVPAKDTTDDARKLITEAWKSLRALGRSPAECLALLGTAEPFNHHPALLQELKEHPPA